MTRPILTSVLALTVAMSAMAQDPGIRGKLDSVTVYRGQALVTRVVEVPGPAGLREVVVSGLPASVQGGSLYAESANGVEIRSVLYRERAVEHDIRAEVRKLDDRIRDLSDQITANQRMTAVLQEQRRLLDEQAKFVAATGTVEMTRGVLNAETLKTITTFQFQQRESMAAAELTKAKELRGLQEQLALVQRERNEMTRGSARTEREAVIFANFRQAPARLRVTYLVSNATWFPSYIVRASGFDRPVTLEYNASIQQQSGEDWSDVQMTLSTATPSLVAMAPVLEPLQIALGAEGKLRSYTEGREELFNRRKEEESRRNINMDQQQFSPQQGQGQQAANNPVNPGGGNWMDNNLNDVSRELQVLELVAKDAKRDPSRGRFAEAVSVSYSLAARTSLPSRADVQMIQISSAPLKAQFYKLATPVLTSYVYNQAELTNEGTTVLLGGPVASYLDGQFVGAGAIPTVAVGQNFTVGFGIDSSLRAERELVEKTESVQGGNRVVNFNYRITVENFAAAPVRVRVMDRLPTAKENEVRVSLVSSNPPISDDAAYLAGDRKKGLLRWDVEAKAQTMGPKALELSYQFRLEYDRQMGITGLPAAR